MILRNDMIFKVREGGISQIMPKTKQNIPAHDDQLAHFSPKTIGRPCKGGGAKTNDKEHLIFEISYLRLHTSITYRVQRSAILV